ncbi:MAG: hypothetical protein R3C44_04415 [Chloroflexota bacterium]
MGSRTGIRMTAGDFQLVDETAHMSQAVPRGESFGGSEGRLK